MGCSLTKNQQESQRNIITLYFDQQETSQDCIPDSNRQIIVTQDPFQSKGMIYYYNKQYEEICISTHNYLQNPQQQMNQQSINVNKGIVLKQETIFKIALSDTGSPKKYKNIEQNSILTDQSRQFLENTQKTQKNQKKGDFCMQQIFIISLNGQRIEEEKNHYEIIGEDFLICYNVVQQCNDQQIKYSLYIPNDNSLNQMEFHKMKNVISQDFKVSQINEKIKSFELSSGVITSIDIIHNIQEFQYLPQIIFLFFPIVCFNQCLELHMSLIQSLINHSITSSQVQSYKMQIVEYFQITFPQKLQIQFLRISIYYPRLLSVAYYQLLQTSFILKQFERVMDQQSIMQKIKYGYLIIIIIIIVIQFHPTI